MPSTIKVRINGASNLPVMDRNLLSGQLYTDAYVSCTLGGHRGWISHDKAVDGGKDKVYSVKTRVERHSLNPVWNEEFRFEVGDDARLQDEPLIFKVWDSDNYKADGCVGMVYVDLNPLLMRTATEEKKEKEQKATGPSTSTGAGTGTGTGTGDGGGGSVRGDGEERKHSLSDAPVDVDSSLPGAEEIRLREEASRAGQSSSSQALQSSTIEGSDCSSANNGEVGYDKDRDKSNVDGNGNGGSDRDKDVHDENDDDDDVSNARSNNDDGDGDQNNGGDGGIDGDSVKNDEQDNQSTIPEEQEELTIEGLFPIYDTLAGVRGELSLSIKLQFIGDLNPFRDSSAGVQLFPLSELEAHSRWEVSHVFGFVEELGVADDPEYEWKDQFRQARYSNEQRQSLLYVLDASVRRQLCKKVLEMGGNAVLGYCQNFDVEGDSGIVARSYGTAVLIRRKGDESATQAGLIKQNDASSHLEQNENGKDAMGVALEEGQQPDDNIMGAQPLGNMIASANPMVAETVARIREGNQEEDVQLLTLREFGPEVRIRMGGLVTARSVKYLGKLATKLSDQETRDGWWSELRDEIRSHARTLCCWHVVGYSESSTIYDDVCILSVTGTAATVRGLPDLTREYRLQRQWELQRQEIMMDGNSIGTREEERVNEGMRESDTGISNSEVSNMTRRRVS